MMRLDWLFHPETRYTITKSESLTGRGYICEFDGCHEAATLELGIGKEQSAWEEIHTVCDDHADVVCYGLWGKVYNKKLTYKEVA